VPDFSGRRCEGDEAREPTPLVLKTERSDKTSRSRCLRAFVVGGVVIPCQRRDCLSCGPRRARETARILLLDAKQEPPTHCIALTTRDPATTAEMYRTASEAVFRRLRRRFGRVEYFGRIEFTTGRGPGSGGARRIHGHYVVKGLAGVACAEAEEIVRGSWRRSLARNGSSFEAWRIEVAELRTPVGALHYLSLHHAKAEQLPPEGWRGMAERPSRGYFSRPIAELREEARGNSGPRAWHTRVGSISKMPGGSCSRSAKREPLGDATTRTGGTSAAGDP